MDLREPRSGKSGLKVLPASASRLHEKLRPLVPPKRGGAPPLDAFDETLGGLFHLPGPPNSGHHNFFRQKKRTFPTRTSDGTSRRAQRACAGLREFFRQTRRVVEIATQHFPETRKDPKRARPVAEGIPYGDRRHPRRRHSATDIWTLK